MGFLTDLFNNLNFIQNAYINDEKKYINIILKNET